MIKMEKRSLEIRRILKRRKPSFLRQDGHKKKRLHGRWRRPKGIQNKVRLLKRGYRRLVTNGFKSPGDVRGFHGKGVPAVHIFSTKELEKVPKEKAIIIASSVSDKKRLEIVKTAKEKSLQVLNLDADRFIAKAEEDMKKRKEKKRKKAAEVKKKEQAEKEEKDKQETEEKPKPKPEEKEEKKSIETIAEEETENRKDKEKREKDKVLTQKS